MKWPNCADIDVVLNFKSITTSSVIQKQIKIVDKIWSLNFEVEQVP